VEPQECETDEDCKDGKHCITEQVHDDQSDFDPYDPNETNGQNRAPVTEESYCK
jgi:hypothetical protein